MNIETFTANSSPMAVLTETPVFRITKELPPHLVYQIESAVKDFVASSHSCQGVDSVGFYNQTIEAIAGSTVLNQGGDFWLGIDDQGVCAYALCRVVKDIDNRLTYWCSQTWIRPDLRGKKWLSFGWQKLKERAKACLCSHMIIVSSRNAEAYKRLLGKQMNLYSSLLKEDI